MTGRSERLAAIVARLVARAGGELILRRDGTAVYDPATGAVSSSATEIIVPGVVEEVELSHPDGLVRRGDRMALIAAASLPEGAPPVPGDVVLIGSTVHRVASVTSSWAGDRPVLHRLHLKA